MSVKDARIVKREPLSPDEAKWVRLVKTTYTDPQSRTRQWEHAERPTRPSGSAVDGVGIVALFDSLPPNVQYLASASADYTTTTGDPGKATPAQDQHSPYVLLQKQFRPALGATVIEIPAGLVDPDETAEVCAVRELEEETGYIGRIVEDADGKHVSPVLWNDPGFCTTNLYMIHVRVDVADERNRAPKPKLEENEFIECFFVPLVEMWGICARLSDEGFAVDARVGTLAEGVQLARRFGVR